MTTVQIRIDEKTKRSAKKVLKHLGMDMSCAIQIYLRQIISKKGIPFPLLTENGLTPEEEDQILKASEEAKRGINVTEPMTLKKALTYLKKL